MTRSREMETAAFALKCVEHAMSTRAFADYVSKAKSAPAAIMENGLLQTLAFYQEKGGDAEKGNVKPEALLAVHMIHWLSHPCPWRPGKQFLAKPEHGAIAELLKLDTPAYRRATAEVLELLSWIKRLGAGQSKLSGRQAASKAAEVKS